MTDSLCGSFFQNLPDATQREQFEELYRSKSFRIERITSSGQSSPHEFWYNQAWDEWGLVFQGGQSSAFKSQKRHFILPRVIGS
jgi:cupin 2 domain-containing protein